MAPVQASEKLNEKKVFSKLQDWRAEQKPRHNLGDLIRTSDIISVSSMGDSTNFSHKFYTKTELI